MDLEQENKILREQLLKAIERKINPPIMLPIDFDVYQKVLQILSKIPKRSKFYKHAQAAIKEVAPKQI